VIIAGILWWIPARSAYLPNWSMVMCDVGQGDGLVLRDQQGPVVLVDVGARGAEMDVCLDELGVERIDAVVLTHFHADHVGGLARILDTREVGALWATPVQDPSDRAALAAVDAESHGLAIQPIRAGDRITFGGSRLDVIWPAHPISAGSIANNASVVLLGDVSGISVLLTGDIEPEAQEAIMARVPAIDVVVAKVPHHGSRFQDPDLPRWARAEVALVSVGIDNEYGHPAEETLEAWREAGAMILRTDLQGAVSLARADSGLRIQTARSVMLGPS
jgi:competence protein ComEC